MKKYELDFITDSDLFEHTLDTVKKYRFNINLKEFNKNIVDPIKLTFDSKIYKKDVRGLIEDEIIRQIDKSNTNHIGYFHQNIFNYLGNKWHVPDHGFDVENSDSFIYVEMKNKHNTMNSSSSQKTYMRMQNKLLQNTGATCMLVEVIAKNSQNIVWKIRLDGMPVSDDRIRRVSIDKFYEIVTGNKYAFRQICQQLPKVIDDIISTQELDIEKNTVFEELNSISPDILKSLYLTSFKKYEGFDDFEL
ncbi:type II site-specific deoxyribonuclease (Sau96I-li(EC:3.1.21.4) [uncultured Gammaproteobacteria bacterium]|nr:type II site-specific deoxyribonuclease (Sau96I-li(EC:3.1.21.4) [uncultured Gammaproteobacteria bacterium]